MKSRENVDLEEDEEELEKQECGEEEEKILRNKESVDLKRQEEERELECGSVEEKELEWLRLEFHS